MRDIKTRESRVGSVKTIDRASMLGDRMKQASIKGKEQIIGFDQSDDQTETAYAEEKTLSMAEDSVYAAEHTGENAVERGRELAKMASEKRKVANMATEYYQSGNMEGIKSANLASLRRDVANPASEVTNMASHSGNVANMASQTCQFGKSRRRTTGSPDLTQGISRDKAESMLKRQYQIRKARESVTRKAERSGKRILASLRRVIRDSKFITGSLAVAGSVALIAIIVCTFFGSAFYILGDENNEGYILGGFEGIGDAGIVAVAASQVGNIGGEPYWSWYGFNDRVEWCACFVSWCANQCGYISDGIIPKFAGVGTGINWFQNRGQWQGRGYHPKPGDIIFFDWDGDGYGNHVGIVESSDDTYVYTIEGNSGDRCKRRTYFITSSMIMGYGIPAYPAAAIPQPEE